MKGRCLVASPNRIIYAYITTQTIPSRLWSASGFQIQIGYSFLLIAFKNLPCGPCTADDARTNNHRPSKCTRPEKVRNDVRGARWSGHHQSGQLSKTVVERRAAVGHEYGRTPVEPSTSPRCAVKHRRLHQRSFGAVHSRDSRGQVLVQWGRPPMGRPGLGECIVRRSRGAAGTSQRVLCKAPCSGCKRPHVYICTCWRV